MKGQASLPIIVVALVLVGIGSLLVINNNQAGLNQITGKDVSGSDFSVSSFNNCPDASANGNLVISNATTFSQQIVSCENITVTSSGVLTIDNQAPGNKLINITVNNTFFVASGGIVNATNKGFAGPAAAEIGNGPGGGFSTSNVQYAGGAGHGGVGATSLSSTQPGGVSYGSTSSPIELGSSGGTANNNARGGNGGGAFIINASVRLEINGTIAADGVEGALSSGDVGGSGSGGSIWLITNTFAGTGTIQSNGGKSFKELTLYDDNAGAGSGGRIAIWYNNLNFNGSILASQGTNAQIDFNTSLARADHGTVYFKKQNDNSVDGYFIGGFKGQIIDNAFILNSNTLSGANITLRNFTILPNISMRTDFDGFKGPISYVVSGNGPGGGSGGNGAQYAAGAGYGGAGAISLSGRSGGSAYGITSSPNFFGSSGGTSSNTAGGGNGGGIIIINASNFINISGTLSADGAPGALSSGDVGGSGSGGSIWLITNTFAGTGTIQSNGGKSFSRDPSYNDNAGAGSGGRIAVWYNNSNFNGSILASQGGNSQLDFNTSYMKADHGTVYFKKQNDNSVDGYFIGGFKGQIIDNAFILNSNILSGANITLRNFTILPNISMRTDFDGFKGPISGTVGNGPGHGLGGTSIQFASGAGHGGVGAGSITSNAQLGGNSYGSTSSPVALGSSGGPAVGGSGGNGGGIIIINASNFINISGSLSADGAPGALSSGDVGGSGSGGSIWLITNTFAGTGTIQSNGGKSFNRVSTYADSAGAGSGGRIAVWYNSSNFNGSILASQGSNSFVDFNMSLARADHGTVYFKKQNDNSVDGYFIGGFKGQIIDNAFILNSNTLSGANITLRNFTILPNISMRTDFDGFKGSLSGSIGNGPGAGNGGAVQYAAGAGYGGTGGKSASNVLGGPIYGVLSSPNFFGSSGGRSTLLVVGSGGNGGGIIIINASNFINISGSLSADGAPGIDDAGDVGGSGSGGSIWLITNTFAGTGTIQSNGGKSFDRVSSYANKAGAGAGGRISISYCTNSTANLALIVNQGASYVSNPTPPNTGNGLIYTNSNYCGVSPIVIDDDSDGFNASVDCNDNDPNIIPLSDGLSISRNVTICPGTYNIPNGITIGASNVAVTCNRTLINGTSSSSSKGVSISSVNNVTMTLCNISNYNDGILFSGTSYDLISNNTFSQNGDGVGFDFGTTNNNNLMTNNTFIGGRIAIYMLSLSANNNITNNIFNNQDNDGIYSSICSKSNIKNNVMMNITSNGIEMDSLSDGVIFNNSISKVTTGIKLTSNSVRNNVSFNMISVGTTGINILPATPGAIQLNHILNNNISNISSNAVIIASSSNNITNNIISNSSTGIRLSSASNNTLLNNSFASNIADIITDTSSNNTLVVLQDQNSLKYVYKFINVTSINNLFVNNSIAAVNSSAERNMNVSANISIVVAACTPPIFSFANFTTNANTVLSNGQLCNSTSTPSCNAISCSGNNLTFNVNSFSSYATGCQDADGDGFNSSSSCGVQDCDDSNSSITPLSDGMYINRSVTICPGTFSLPNGININASNSIITCNNTVLDGTGFGITIATSINNITINSCNISNYLRGIQLSTTSNNTISNNILSGNQRSIEFDGSSNTNIVFNNTLTSTVSSNFGIVISTCGLNNNFSNNMITTSNRDLDSGNCNKLVFSNNNITLSGGNDRAVSLVSLINSTIFNNTISGNGVGVRGILMSGSGNNVSFNTILSTTTSGIETTGSGDNIFNNNISSITSNAISITSDNNTISNNLLSGSGKGIVLSSSSNNTFFNNTFAGNTVDILSSTNNNNTLIIANGQNRLSFYSSLINVTNITNLFVNSSIVAVNSSGELQMNVSANISFSVNSCSLALVKSPQFSRTVAGLDSSTVKACDTCQSIICANNLMNFTATSFSTIFVNSAPNITFASPNSTNLTQSVINDTNLTTNTTAISNITFNVTAIDNDSGVLTFNWFVDGVQAFIDTVTSVLGTFTSIFNYVFNSIGIHNVSVVVNDSVSNDTFQFNVNVSCGDRDRDGFNQTSDCGVVDCNDNDASIIPLTNKLNINRSVTICPGTFNLVNGINITAPGIVVTCNNTVINGTGVNSGITLFNITNSNITSCTVQRYNSGLFLNISENNTLLGNVISNSTRGLFIYNSSLNFLSNNSLFNNTADILTQGVRNNTLRIVSGKNLLLYENKFINVSNMSNVVLSGSLVGVNSSAEPQINASANVSLLVSSCEVTLFRTSVFFRDIQSAKGGSPAICTTCSGLMCSNNILNFTTSEFSTLFANSTPTIIRIFPNITNTTYDIPKNESNVSIFVSSGTNKTFNATAIELESNSLTFNWSYDQLGQNSDTKSSATGFFDSNFTFSFLNLSVHNVTVSVNNTFGGTDTFNFMVNVTCLDQDGDGANSTSVCGVVDCDDTNASIRPPLNNQFINQSITLCPGTYNVPNGINLNASNIVLNCNSTVFNSTSPGGTNGISASNVTNVTIQGCAVQDYYSNILFSGTNASRIQNSTMLRGNYSIQLSAISSNNLISLDNITNSTSGIGIFSGSLNNSVIGNIFSGTETGVLINGSTSSNLIINNIIGVNMFINNTAGSKFINSSNSTFVGNNVTFSGTGLFVSISQAINISDNIVKNSSSNCIFLQNSSVSYLINNTVSICSVGISLENSFNNTLLNNIVTQTTDGVNFTSNSSNNQISGNSIGNNTRGMRITASSSNIIVNDSFTNNTASDIFTIDASNSTLVVSRTDYDQFKSQIGESRLTFTNKLINVTDIDNVFINDSIVSVNSSAEPTLNTSANISLIVQSCSQTLLKVPGFYTSISQINTSLVRSCSSCSNIVCGYTGTISIMNFTTTSFSTILAVFNPNITAISPNQTGQLQNINTTQENVSTVIEAGTNQTYIATARDEGSSNLTFTWSVDGVVSFIETVAKDVLGFFTSFFYNVFGDILNHNVSVVVNDSTGNDTFNFRVQSNDSSPPFWNETPLDMTIMAGTPVIVDYNATDLIAISTYFVSDIQNFSMNRSSGVLQNASALSVGNHIINISVNDTQNNILSQQINITVNAQPSSGTTATSGGGGGSGFISSFAPCSGNFTCGEWSSCINGTQFRTCSDLMRCYRPRTENQSCHAPVTGEATAAPPQAKEEVPVTPSIITNIETSLMSSGIIAVIILVLISSAVLVSHKLRSPSFKYRKSFDVVATRDIIAKAKLAMSKDKKLAVHIYNDAVRAYWNLPEEKKELLEKEIKELKDIVSK